MVPRLVRSPVFPSVAAVALLVAGIWYVRSSSSRETVRDARSYAGIGCTAAADMFRRHQSGQWITVSGDVAARLADTHGRLEHQRFILGCRDGLHLLIVNDVSIGERVPLVSAGPIVVRGEYIWDSQGGLIHFTHHDGGGGGGSGWILFNSRVYQ